MTGIEGIKMKFKFRIVNKTSDPTYKIQANYSGFLGYLMSWETIGSCDNYRDAVHAVKKQLEKEKLASEPYNIFEEFN